MAGGWACPVTPLARGVFLHVSLVSFCARPLASTHIMVNHAETVFGLIANIGGVFAWPAYAESFSGFMTLFFIAVFIGVLGMAKSPAAAAAAGD